MKNSFIPFGTQTHFSNAWYPAYFKWFAWKAVHVMCDPIILACMGDDIQLVKSDSHCVRRWQANELKWK